MSSGGARLTPPPPPPPPLLSLAQADPNHGTNRGGGFTGDPAAGRRVRMNAIQNQGQAEMRPVPTKSALLIDAVFNVPFSSQ